MSLNINRPSWSTRLHNIFSSNTIPRSTGSVIRMHVHIYIHPNKPMSPSLFHMSACRKSITSTLNAIQRSTPRATSTTSLPLLSTQPPIILTCELVVQGLDSLSLLPFRHLALQTGYLEERWCGFDKPFRFDCTADMHVFFRGLYKGRIDYVLGRPAEKCGGWMEINRCSLVHVSTSVTQLLSGVN